ncbi:hypothetical protein D1007_52858 [Hordeum vulgare]|nr:hypothetical protein D1007_52858 [Hordeum vulgare]
MGKLCSNAKDQAKLDEWFLSTALDQLEELTFNDGHMRSLPPSTPRVARFMKYHFPQINTDPTLLLPPLDNLELVDVCILNDNMERLLHGCTAFEYLHLHAINGFSSVHIASMIDQQGPTRIRVIYAPNLAVFGYSFVNFCELVIGSITVQVQQSPSSPS